MKAFTLMSLGLLSFSMGSVFAYDDDNGANAHYRVEIQNQTENQWFSPCLCALHSNKVRLFQVGQPATNGQAIFSEDGFNGVLADELRENPEVYAVLQCGAGLTPPGATRIEEISGPVNAHLTCASMPVTTNDVLTTVSRVRTPKQIGVVRNYSSVEWDLGSEEDNYSSASMPEDSLDLVPEGPENPVTISENVVFGPMGRPEGVPVLLSPFSRAFFNAEGTMDIFNDYVGSDEFPPSLYGWDGPASSVAIIRID